MGRRRSSSLSLSFSVVWADLVVVLLWRSWSSMGVVTAESELENRECNERWLAV